MSLQQQNQLVFDHIKTAEMIAARFLTFLPSSVDYESINQSALLGLVEASRQYDPQSSVPFLAFARPRIRGAILDYLRSNDDVGRHFRQWGQKIRIAKNHILHCYQRPATREECATQLNISLATYHAFDMHINTRKIIRESDIRSAVTTKVELLNDESHRDFVEESEEFGFMVPRIDIEERILWQERKAMLIQAMSQLSDKERKVLTLYYYFELELKDVAEILHMGVMGVWKIRKKAEQKIIALVKTCVMQRKSNDRSTIFDTSVQPEYQQALLYRPYQNKH